MKKLFFTLMIISSYLIFNSCSKSDSTPATADVTASFKVTANGTTIANNGTIFLDDSVVVTVTCTGNSSNSLTHLSVACSEPNFNFGNGPYDTVLTGISAIKNTPRWAAQGDGPITFTATVKGSTGNPAVVTFTVNVVQVIAGFQTLGNQKNTASNQLFSSSVINNNSTATFGLSDVAAVTGLDTAIDFAYCTKTTLYYLVSPDDSIATRIYGTEWPTSTEAITNWPVRNKTRFIQINNITAQQFDAATTNTALLTLLNKAKAGGEPNRSSVAIIDTQIFLFKTAGGKYGLIRIIAPSPAWDGNTASAISGDVQLHIAFFN